MNHRGSAVGHGRRGLLLLAALAAGVGASAAQVAGRLSRTSALGTLVACEPVARRVTLQTSDGRQTFVLAEDATVREGLRRIELDRIAALLGRMAKVRYQTVGGRRVARQLTVAATTTREQPTTMRRLEPDERE